jgi:hypothetical protein
VRVLSAITLQSTEIIDVTEFRAQVLQNLPVALLAIFPDLAFHEIMYVGDDAVVVQKRIVYVKEEDNLWRIHVA